MSVSIEAVQRSLADLRIAYQADGYDLIVDGVADGVAKVRIAAGADACADCLVPKPIAVEMIKASLDAVPEVKDVELTYP